MNILKGFADSFEEIHYLIGGVAVGIIVGIIITITVFKLVNNITGD